MSYPITPSDRQRLHRLEVIRGYGANINCLMADDVTIDPAQTPAAGYVFHSGRVVHRNPAGGYYSLGHSGLAMPVFLWPGPGDADVTIGEDVSGVWGWAGFPNGRASGFVASGGFELETTEFAATTYAPQDPLHAPTAAQTNVPAEAGVLYKARTWGSGNSAALTAANDSLCGVVSSRSPDAAANHWRINVLRFYSVYKPGPSGA